MDEQRKNYRHLDTITGLFVAILIISNIASTKILNLGIFTFDGGTIIFPLSYIFGDILTEVYGYRRSRKVIWTGFICLLMMSLVLWIVQILPPAQGWENQEAFSVILGQALRIVAASLIGYFLGEFSNSYVLAKMKIFTKGRYLWTRTIGSTIVGEFVDTAAFVLIAFLGAIPGGLLFSVLISNYIFKTGVEVVFTPLTYKIIGWLKRQESEDYYDINTNFNPFKVADF